MASEVKTVNHKLSVSEVVDIQITEIVVATGYARAIRIFGAPDGTDGPAILEIVVTSATRANIEITTPEVNF